LVSDFEGRSQVEGPENRVPRKIFGPKRDEVTGEWGRLYNDEDLRGLCCSVSAFLNPIIQK
jgi:hypothetical protein